MIHVRILALASFALSATALAACSENAQAAPSSTAVTQTQALAADGGSADREGRHHPHGPPPEAFDACASRAAGDACNVAFHEKTLAGTCTAPPAGASDARLFCLPKDMPPPPAGGGAPHAPPPEAFTACEGKAAAAACAVTFGDHTMNGTCLQPPPDSGETRLACAPPHGPGGPGGRPPHR